MKGCVGMNEKNYLSWVLVALTFRGLLDQYRAVNTIKGYEKPPP